MAAACGSPASSAPPVGNGAGPPSVIGAPSTVRAADPQTDAVPAAPAGKPMLTLTGRITATNAGGTLRLDGLTLGRLGLLSMSVNDPWAKQRLNLQGVWLRDVIALAHPDPTATTLHLKALDDYQVDLQLADVRTAAILLATRNGQGAAIPVEDGGPTRIVFADDLANRFSPDLWIWNIETIEVR